MACGEVYGGTTFVPSPSVNGLPVIGGGLSCLRASSSKGLITESSLAPTSLGTLDAKDRQEDHYDSQESTYSNMTDSLHVNVI